MLKLVDPDRSWEPDNDEDESGRGVETVCRWDRRFKEQLNYRSKDVVRHTLRLNVPYIRHDRRALTDEEFLKLVEAARKSDKSVEGMTGPERCFLYTMARMTGLRRSELASLTAASFVLGTDSFAIVEAGYSKHRQRDVLPLHPDLVPLVREWIIQLHNGDPLFYLLEQRKTAKMMQVDLEVAGIPYQDANGLYADFHALRHSFIIGGLGIRGNRGGGNGSGQASQLGDDDAACACGPVGPGACRQWDAVPSEKGPRELGVDNKKCCPPHVVFGHDVRWTP